MDRIEFAKIMAYLSAGCGKPMPAEAAEVYFDILGELPAEVLKTAAKRVVLEHPWATFPSIAELRAAAVDTMRGVICELSPAECWDLAWGAASRIDLELPYTIEKFTKDLPPIVLECMHTFGIPALVYGKEPVGVVRGQFMKIAEQLLARDRREALLPPSVKREIAAQRPPAVAGVIGLIGQEKP